MCNKNKGRKREFCTINIYYMTKKSNYIVLSVALLLGASACKNNAPKSETQNFITYVDSIDKVEHVYTVENWDNINNEYNQRIATLEQEVANMEEDEKARLEESKAKFAKLKANYEAKIAESSQTVIVNNKRQLRDRLFGQGVISEDMQFSFVTGKNALSVYETFVNTVVDNKESYSREDWDEIKVLYEALDTRKNAIEKDLATKDNLKIAALKIKFATVNTIDRSGSKVDENSEAKK